MGRKKSKLASVRGVSVGGQGRGREEGGRRSTARVSFCQLSIGPYRRIVSKSSKKDMHVMVQGLYFTPLAPGYVH